MDLGCPVIVKISPEAAVFLHSSLLEEHPSDFENFHVRSREINFRNGHAKPDVVLSVNKTREEVKRFCPQLQMGPHYPRCKGKQHRMSR
jgi:hypothetical protein